MNYRLLSKVFGTLLLLLSFSMLICFVYAWYEGRNGSENPAMHALGISALFTACAATLLILFGRSSATNILRKEAIVVVGMGWIICALFGSIPYLLCQPSLPFVKAFFESVSGFTTTGATVISDLTVYPKSILLWRSLTQWLGGLGILVLFVAVLAYLGVGNKSLMRHESSFQVGESSSTRIRNTALKLWLIYITLTLICALGLKLLGMPTYEAICHAFTTVSTAGFSPHNESIAYYNSLAIEVWICLFMLICSISFMLYAALLRYRWDRLKKEEEAKVFLGIAATAICIVCFSLLLDGRSLLQSLRECFFPVIAIITTTGYATVDFDQWPSSAKIVLAILMIIGGCSGATAGGLKISRVILFFKISKQEVIKSFRPNRVFPLQINGNPTDESAKLQTMFYIAMIFAVCLLSAFLISLFELKIDFISVIGIVLSAVFNIGPGFGDVGPTKNFADLTSATHLLLSLIMILGRLELFAILALFIPSLWKKY